MQAKLSALSTKKPIHSFLAVLWAYYMGTLKFIVKHLVALLLQAWHQTSTAVIYAQNCIICPMGDINGWLTHLWQKQHTSAANCPGCIGVCQIQIYQ